MNILKNNYNKKEVNVVSYPRKLICEDCRSELEYEESDLRMGEYGCMFVDCPLCGYENMLEDNEHNITLTADNIEFPVHFNHVSTETGAVDICNTKEIRKYLNKAISYLRNNKDEWYYGGHITGNLYILVRKYDGDEMYEVTVSNNFYNIDIPFNDYDRCPF